MSIFEYLMVMVSIMLGLGATQILCSFSKIAQSSQAFLPVTMWAGVLFYLYLQLWWALWDLNTVPVWNQFQFYYLVALPCTLFAATELLLPLGSSANTDWKGHFFRVQKWFFSVFFVFMVLAVMHTYVFLNVSLIHPYRGLQAIVIGILTVGFFAKHTRTHAWLSAVFIFLVLVGQILFRYLPGLG